MTPTTRWVRRYAILGITTLLTLLPFLGSAQGLTTLYSFPSVPGSTIAPPVEASDGNLYIPVTGGPSGAGQVVRMPLGGGPPTTIYMVTDGYVPGGSGGRRLSSALIQGRDGNLYGVAEEGGAFNCGAVFKLSLSGVCTELYSFTGGADGKNPQSALLQGSDGNLYGTTSHDEITESSIPPGFPNYAGGTVFEISPDAGGEFSPVGPGGSTFTVLHTFSENYHYAFGYMPALIEGADHYLYGVQPTGGSQIYAPSTYGHIYRMALGGGSFTILYQFLAGNDDGAGPLGITQASDGCLYGGNSYCPNASGSVWKFDLGSNTLTTVARFPVLPYFGASPTKLVQASDGNLYGTVVNAAGASQIYSMPLGGGDVTFRYTFTGGSDGLTCYEGAIAASDGNLYGTTFTGGDNGAGTIWEYGFSPVKLGKAGDYAVLGVGTNTQMTLSGGGSRINGNIGEGPASSFTFSGGGLVSGNIDYDPSASVPVLSGGSSATGGAHATSLAQARVEALAAANQAGSLSPTVNLSGVNNATVSIGSSGAVTVINVQHDIVLSGGHTLTLSGSATAYVVVNVQGSLNLSAGSAVLLTGGLSADHVFFNFVGTGSGVTLNGNSVLNGTILAVQRDISISGGTVNGSVIGALSHKLKLSGVNVNR